MEEERGDRLRKARLAAGFKSGAAAVERFGWTRNTYKSNENGHAPFGYEAAKDYASAFGVRPEWLYDGRGPMHDGVKRTVPLVGYVRAGGEYYYASADEGLGEVDAPDGATEHTRAALVRGGSLGPLFEEWLVFYDEVRDPVTPDLIGRLCVVGLPNGKVLVKKLQKVRGEDRYHLLSNNEDPILDQEVSWAAKVKTMTPR